MGFVEDKKKVLEEAGILKIIRDIQNTETTFSFNSSTETSKNILPYLLDLLSVLTDSSDEEKKDKVKDDPEKEKDTERGFDFKLPGKGKLLNKKKKEGEEEEPEEDEKKKKGKIEKLLLEILNKSLPKIIKLIKDSIINGIVQTTSCSSDFLVPPNSKVNLLVSQIDFFNNFKNNPQGQATSFLFGDEDKDFDTFILKTIQTPNQQNTWSGPNGPLIDLTFFSYSTGTTTTAAQPNSIDFKINQNYTDPANNRTFVDFLIDFMDSLEIFSKEKFLATIIDSIFGLIAANSDITTDQVIDEEKTNKLIDNLLDKDPCDDEIVYDNSFFTFDNSDLAEIENKAKGKKLGITELDLGCGIFSFNLSENLTNITNILDDIKNNNNNPVLQDKKTIQLIDNICGIAAESSPINAESIKNKFNSDIIKDLPKALIKNSFMKPSIVAITNLANFVTTASAATQNNGFDYAKYNIQFFEYIARESWAIIVEVAFNILKREALIIVRKVAIYLLKKAIKKIKAIIKSYTKEDVAGTSDGTLIPLNEGIT